MRVTPALLIALLIPTSFFLQGGLAVTSAANPGSIQSFSYESTTIVQYHLPNGSSQPWGIVSDSSTGLLWFVEQGSNQVGSFDPTNNTFLEYNIPTPNSLPESLAIDASHNVWISQLQFSQLGELVGAKGPFLQFNIPKGPDNLDCGPIGVTPSQDGNVWITCEFSNQLDEFFPSNSTFHEFDLPVFYSAPLQMVFDAAGNFWFTAADSNMLGYVTVSQLQNGTSNGINEFTPTNQSFVTTISDPQQTSGNLISSLSTPSQLVLSPDGKTLWITEHTASSFDRYDIQTKTLVKYWTPQTHNPNYIDSLPNGIELDKNGDLWIAEHYANKIAEFNPVTERLIEYPIPCCGSGIAGALYLAIAPSGSVWFTEFFGNSIGELIPSSAVQPISLAFADGNPIYNITSNENQTVPLFVSFNDSQAKNATVGFDTSGISYTGKLENLTATFDPSSVTLSNGMTKSLNLILQSKGLRGGTDYITVSAKNLADNVTYSIILKLNVASASSNLKSLVVEAAIVGATASIVVVASMILFFRRKGSSSRRRAFLRNRHQNLHRLMIKTEMVAVNTTTKAATT
ncbi:MAG: Vgb family protein [Nitrososphaerales archaeon]